jgi:hypothetical protein
MNPRRWTGGARQGIWWAACAAWIGASAVRGAGGPDAPPVPPAQPETQARPEAPALPPMPYEDEVVQAVFRAFPHAKPEEVLSFIRSQFPLGYFEFRRALMQGRDRAAEVFTSLVRESLEMMETRARNPERFEQMQRQRDLERKAGEQAEASRRHSGQELERSLGELRHTLDEAFDLKQRLMKEEVRDLEGELKKLEDLIARREQNRADIIERRIAEMTGAMDHVKW